MVADLVDPSLCLSRAKSVFTLKSQATGLILCNVSIHCLLLAPTSVLFGDAANGIHEAPARVLACLTPVRSSQEVAQRGGTRLVPLRGPIR